MSDQSRNYSTPEITVHWKPRLCIHSGVCARSLNTVFQPKEKPWIKVDADSLENIIATIDRCPSGALSYTLTPKQDDAQ